MKIIATEISEDWREALGEHRDISLVSRTICIKVT